MSIEQKLLAIWILASVIVLSLRDFPSTRHDRWPPATMLIGWSLFTVAAGLFVVGAVSHTLRVHLVQITPLVLVLVLLALRSEWGITAAAPLFAFWLITMGFIWLFLLGISRFLTGRFSNVEIALTLVIGVASLVGLAGECRHMRSPATIRPPQIAAMFLFGGVQTVAMWLSYQPFVAMR